MDSSILTSPRFVVSINGEQRCIAGFDGYAVLSATLTQTRGVHKGDPNNRYSSIYENSATLRVGGLEKETQVDWFSDDVLVGDEIRIKICEDEPIDQTIPSEVDRTTFAEQLKQLRDRIDKTDKASLKRVSVLRNGEHLCTAGVESGVLSVHITWVYRNPDQQPPNDDSPIEQWVCGETELSVGGMENNEHIDWIDTELNVGDEVTIKLLGPGPIDEPASHTKYALIPHRDQLVMMTGSVSLRKLIDDDLDFLCEMLSDVEVMRYFPEPLDRDGAKQWLEKQQQRYIDDGCGYWLVVDNETHKPVGQAGVLMTEVDGEILPALGYMIHRPYWRQGYAIDAVFGCMYHVFDTLKRDVVYTLIRPENEPSLALAKKLKMKEVRKVEFKGYEHLLLAYEKPKT